MTKKIYRFDSRQELNNLVKKYGQDYFQHIPEGHYADEGGYLFAAEWKKNKPSGFYGLWTSATEEEVLEDSNFIGMVIVSYKEAMRELKETQKPSNLPEYPEAPEGYHYEYRGEAWNSHMQPVRYITFLEGQLEWFGLGPKAACPANGYKGMHYAELVKDEVVFGIEDKFQQLKKEYNEAKKLIGKEVYYGSVNGVVEEVKVCLEMGEKCSAAVNGKVRENGYCVYLVCGNFNFPYQDIKIKPTVKINGYEAEDCGTYVKFGCAKISKAQLKRAQSYLSREAKYDSPNHSNRQAKSIKIGAGEFTLEDINDLLDN